MNGVTDPQEPDTLDRIANALPPEVRADYYREMRHLRSLPENDEMLRILRAMQFLGVLFLMLHLEPPLRTRSSRRCLPRRSQHSEKSWNR